MLEVNQLIIFEINLEFPKCACFIILQHTRGSTE